MLYIPIAIANRRERRVERAEHRLRLEEELLVAVEPDPATDERLLRIELARRDRDGGDQHHREAPRDQKGDRPRRDPIRADIGYAQLLPGHEIAATGLPVRGLRIGAIVGAGVGRRAAARRSSARVQFAQHLDGGFASICWTSASGR